MESIAEKHILSQKSFFIDAVVDFYSLLEALGTVVLVFVALETGLKIDGSSGGNRMQN